LSSKAIESRWNAPRDPQLGSHFSEESSDLTDISERLEVDFSHVSDLLGG
jgi:hypothetical protein